MDICLGMDIGGTKIKISAFAKDTGKELFSKQISTPKSYPDFLQAASELVREADEATEKSSSLGIGIPGLVFPPPDPHLFGSINLPFLEPYFTKELSKSINRPVYIENDANCFAISEAEFGAAKGYASAFCAIIGSGVGAGIVINNKIVCGPNALTGEWGHLNVPFANEKERETLCGCGEKGCIEALVSGPALVKQYNEASATKVSSAEEIVSATAQNDKKAQKVLDTLYDRLARSFLHILYLFDPEVIVLGGGVSQIPGIYTEVPKKLAVHTQGKFSSNAVLNLKPAANGPASGIIGAAWLWKYQSKSG